MKYAAEYGNAGSRDVDIRPDSTGGGRPQPRGIADCRMSQTPGAPLRTPTSSAAGWRSGGLRDAVDGGV